MSDATFNSNSLDCCPCDVPDRYEFTTDEDRGLVRAERIFAVFSSGRVTATSEIDLFHGAAPDVIALLLQKLVPTVSENSRHLVFALFEIAGVYRLPLREQMGQRVGRFFCGPIPRDDANVVRLHVYQPQRHSTRDLAACLHALQSHCFNEQFCQPTSPIEDRRRNRTSWPEPSSSVFCCYPWWLRYFLAVFFKRPSILRRTTDLTRRIVRLTGVAVLGGVAGFILFFSQLFFGEINQPGASTRLSEIHKWTHSTGNDVSTENALHRDDAHIFAGARDRGNALCPPTSKRRRAGSKPNM